MNNKKNYKVYIYTNKINNKLVDLLFQQELAIKVNAIVIVQNFEQQFKNMDEILLKVKFLLTI